MSKGALWVLWLSLPLLPVVVQGSVSQALLECRQRSAGEARLLCYDAIDPVKRHQAAVPRFTGRLSQSTEQFIIEKPTRLRYQSDGAIFVLALHRADGRVVQNLHIGGAGEDSYLIQQPGKYFLRINGSTTWRIWLENPDRSQ
ncbi:hypothetical protein ACFVYJ_08125 [Pontibacter sp. JAM-7]|uniref:hypothetical protein n=1 Tax=Pontibacter sp. JAM-7 TaxID=3366581 RepID=UPI003AF4211E